MTDEAPAYARFRADMEAAGYKVQHYDGRNFYHGPAVVVPPYLLQDVIRATSVRVQTDSLGRNLLIYPAVKMLLGGADDAD